MRGAGSRLRSAATRGQVAFGASSSGANMSDPGIDGRVMSASMATLQIRHGVANISPCIGGIWNRR